jgi:hypothetical protein
MGIIAIFPVTYFNESSDIDMQIHIRLIPRTKETWDGGVCRWRSVALDGGDWSATLQQLYSEYPMVRKLNGPQNQFRHNGSQQIKPYCSWEFNPDPPSSRLTKWVTLVHNTPTKRYVPYWNEVPVRVITSKHYFQLMFNSFNMLCTVLYIDLPLYKTSEQWMAFLFPFHIVTCLWLDKVFGLIIGFTECL